MSDIRFRLLSLVLLSVLCFADLAGAAAVFCWWLAFGAKTMFARLSWRTVLPVLVVFCLFPSAVLFFTGGDVFYGAKIFVLALLAFWFSASLLPGELMSLFVRVFGQGMGFDLGMTAELSVQALSGIREDLFHMRSALRIKGQRFSPGAVPFLGAGLLVLSLRRSAFSAAVLARRGYVSGGTYVPVFSPGAGDVVRLVFAVLLYGVLFF